MRYLHLQTKFALGDYADRPISNVKNTFVFVA